MNAQGAGKTLPIILAAITLATALFFWKQREVLRQKTQELLDRSGKQISLKLPEPTPFVPVKQYQYATPTPIVTPTPTVTPNVTTSKKTRTVAMNTRSQTTTTTICTPVYGMANSCVEHTVVDTALDTTIFYNLAGLSYFAGLAAFIKAKKRA